MRKLLTEFKYLSYFIVVARNFQINKVICQRVRYFIRLCQIAFIHSGIVFWFRVRSIIFKFLYIFIYTFIRKNFNPSLRLILKIFLKLRQFQPRYSYKVYSYKKGVQILITFSFFQIQELGLQQEYNNDKGTYQYLRKIMELAFLPED